MTSADEDYCLTSLATSMVDERRISSGLPPKGRDLIFVSIEDWDDIWRRNQFLCAAYSKRHPEARILFVAPPIDVSHALRRGKIAQLRSQRFWTPPGYPNITVTRGFKLAPSRLQWGRNLNDSMTRSHVTRVAAQCGLRDPVLWLNPHWAAHMAGRMGESAVIYDVTDDWTCLTQTAASTELVVEQDLQLCKAADAVIVCSERLLELKRPIARHVELIPNGVDATHYRRVLDSKDALPPDAASWPKPVLGYTGTVHPDRVDYELLIELARQWKGSIVMVGPVHRKADLTSANISNLILTDAVAYERLPDLMRAFDACIVPHRVTKFTESLNPIKLWEYLAAGKPIVSTNVAGFRDYPQFVRFAGTAAEFISEARAGMAEPAEVANARRTEALTHSWESRLNQVEAVIDQCIAARQTSKKHT